MSQTKQVHSKLIAACKNKNAKAQVQLYDMYCNAMFITAHNFVRREDIAEELMHEAFLKAFKNIDSFTGKVTFGAWLKKIVINQCIDWLKKRKLKVVYLDEHAQDISNEDDWEVEDHITIEEIHSAIDALPDKYKIVVKLYLLEGYDHEEISQILNITEVASRSQLHRGKNKLKELLKKYHYA